MSKPIYSIIIPQRNSLKTLPRLFASIPEREDIEILLVDNTPTPVTKEEIGIDREYKLLWSAPERCAGGARNEGIENAKGDWLIFADSDDYFAPGAFAVFDTHYDELYDVIYFSSIGVYDDTGEFSNRCEPYPTMVRKFEEGEYNSDLPFRLSFDVPWSKMVRKSLVDNQNIRFDEVKAANDVMFSLNIGFLAQSVNAYNKIVYICTVSKGSLTQLRSFDATYSRFMVELRRSRFLKDNNLGDYQRSIMVYFLQSVRSKPQSIFRLCLDMIKYRQNPLIGCGNWFRTFANSLKRRKTENKYKVK